LLVSPNASPGFHQLKKIIHRLCPPLLMYAIPIFLFDDLVKQDIAKGDVEIPAVRVWTFNSDI
jgi:hypothetical protein